MTKTLDIQPLDLTDEISRLPEHNRTKPWTPLQAWAIANEPNEKMLYKQGFWSQIMLVRDDIGRMLGERLKEISVVSTHTSKSITLPVFMITLHDGTRFIMRDNMHNWVVTAISRDPILLNRDLFSIKEDVHPVYAEGFSSEWVLGSYSQNNKEFTIDISNDQRLIVFFLSITKPDPMIADLASSLERTAHRLQAVLASKPVRDADETLEEARHILKKAGITFNN